MKKRLRRVSGNIVNVLNSEIYPGILEISDGKIINIIKSDKVYDNYIMPGFVDSHVHVESSMLTPSEFARVAVIHGTVAAVSDPHEIANVLGIEGVKYMIEDAKRVPFKFYFGVPSCVPATPFETSGDTIGPEQVEELLKSDEIKFLAEVMNFPGVLEGNADVIAKIGIAKKYSKLIDGHAPGLKGEDLKKYVNTGISTDHECNTKEEALEKIKLGMKIQIREGSAAKNFDELAPIIEEHYANCMFCSDDKHPEDLIRGHINELVKRALNLGIDLMKVLMVTCVNPVLHYKLDVGLLRKGDFADFLIVDNLDDFNILKTYINGELVARRGRTLIRIRPSRIVNNFKVKKKHISDFTLPWQGDKINVIEAVDNELITERSVTFPRVVNGLVVPDIERDILKLVVVNRYEEAQVAIGFVKNFGLKSGAIASSVAHDSHNIVAVGTNDKYICRAVNLIIENKGGISAVSEDVEMVLPLPIAGIMSEKSYPKVANKYIKMNEIAKSFGSNLTAPFMILSFMALLVIPKLKMSDKGLFEVQKFQFIDVFEKSQHDA